MMSSPDSHDALCGRDRQFSWPKDFHFICSIRDNMEFIWAWCIALCIVGPWGGEGVVNEVMRADTSVWDGDELST